MEGVNKRLMKCYSKKSMVHIARTVSNNYKTGTYTLESACNNAGVPYRTFKHWWDRYYENPEDTRAKSHCLAEVAELWEKAQELHHTYSNQALVKKAETALEKKITGYEYEETETMIKKVIGPDGIEAMIPTGLKKVKKYCPPSDRAIQFVLTKLNPDVYGRTDTVINPAINNNYYRGRTLAEIDAEINELMQDSTNTE